MITTPSLFAASCHEKSRPLGQPDAHGIKISGRHDSHNSAQVLILGVRARRIQQAPASIAIQWQHVRDAGSFNAGKRFHLPENFLQDDAALYSVVSIVIVDGDCGSVAGLKAKFNIQDAKKTTQQQASADE